MVSLFISSIRVAMSSQYNHPAFLRVWRIRHYIFNFKAWFGNALKLSGIPFQIYTYYIHTLCVLAPGQSWNCNMERIKAQREHDNFKLKTQEVIQILFIFSVFSCAGGWGAHSVSLMWMKTEIVCLFDCFWFPKLLRKVRELEFVIDGMQSHELQKLSKQSQVCLVIKILHLMSPMIFLRER